MEVRQNQLTGADFPELKALFPSLYKLKFGDNPIKTENLKNLANISTLKKIELSGTEAAKKETYRDDLFKILKNIESIDRLTKEGDEVDSTIYDDEDDEFDDMDDELDEDAEDMEDDEDISEDEDDEEDEVPKNPKKQRRE